MNRRLFMASTAALIAAPKLALAGGAGTIDYTPGLVKTKLEAGETLLVDYAAEWCGTCKRQERVISELRAANPEYDSNMTFVRVDWDQFGRHEVATSREVYRRSTLVLLRGDEMLGRVDSGTSVEVIKNLLDLGIAKA